MTIPRIFVSHSHTDDVFGQRLIADLRTILGEEAVWYDANGLRGGDEWWNNILAEITARDTFIILLSPEALGSKWVNDEITIAWRQKNTIGKRILPLLVLPCLVREDLTTLQIISFVAPRAYAEAFAALKHALTTIDAAPQVASPPLPAANDVKSQLTERLIAEIHTAFNQEDWANVARKTTFLLDETHYLEPQLWRERGLALMELGKGENALIALDKFLEQDCYDVPILLAKARTLKLLKQYNDMIAVYERILAFIDENSPRTRYDILFAGFDSVYDCGLLNEALSYIDEALQLYPADEFWTNAKAGTLADLGRFHEAECVQPTCSIIWKNIGMGFLSKGLYGKALVALSKAYSIDTDDKDILKEIKKVEELEYQERITQDYEERLALDHY